MRNLIKYKGKLNKRLCSAENSNPLDSMFEPNATSDKDEVMLLKYIIILTYIDYK